MSTNEKKRILVVEDERPMAQALKLKLLHEGFEVEVASNGEMTFKFVDEIVFDLILLDLVMPKVDGFEVLKWLEEHKKKIPVFVLSNLSQMEDEAKVKELGAKEFFVKSDVPIADIVECVKKELS